eukprot:12627326-Alexandrium_andersonii.AAC.1
MLFREAFNTPFLCMLTAGGPDRPAHRVRRHLDARAQGALADVHRGRQDRCRHRWCSGQRRDANQ